MKKNCTISSTRSSNIELLRIICMLLIIIGHIIMNHHDDNVTEYFISHILRPFTVVGVNVFVIISGYFGINYKTDRLITIVFSNMVLLCYFIFHCPFFGFAYPKPQKRYTCFLSCIQ